MYYYKFNIADWHLATSHLSLEEEAIYFKLINFYYDSEQAIPLETDSVIRRLRLGSVRDIVGIVLKEFFVLQEDGWHHLRCDDEISKYHYKAEVNQRIGKLGGRPKKTESVSVGIPEITLTKNQEPLTINQEPITNIKPLIGETKFPPCPYDSLLLLWKKHLPHLTQPRTWEGSRQANMKSRWIQASKPSQYSPDGYKTKEDGIEWWDGFFSYIATDTKLAEGFESKDRSWKPDLQWILLPANFQKIIDGNYNK
jgi:uncharacterized protein YdaU (DUF1376 family)